MHLAGFTSTGSKRPDVLYGDDHDGLPIRMRRSLGCQLWDQDDRPYLDFLMALGAVGLGYAHPAVNSAVIDAVERGTIGSLAPLEEEALAADLSAMIPSVQKVRFLKTGAEAAAAAIRIARTATGRDAVLGCGYHGWLDWCSESAGVPEAVRRQYAGIPFNDIERTVTAIRERENTLAAVMIEPVVDGPPDPEWLAALRRETARVGAVLIFDEIKTAFRVGIGGAAARWGGDPDLVVLGKAMANGYPLAAVAGSADVMHQVRGTWISSTMATEFVSLAAARATLQVVREQRLPEWLDTLGTQLLAGLRLLAERYPQHVAMAAGIPEMCHLRYHAEATGQLVARECAVRGILFKRTGYNFVSLSHRTADVELALTVLDDILGVL